MHLERKGKDAGATVYRRVILHPHPYPAGPVQGVHGVGDRGVRIYPAIGMGRGDRQQAVLRVEQGRVVRDRQGRIAVGDEIGLGGKVEQRKTIIVGIARDHRPGRNGDRGRVHVHKKEIGRPAAVLAEDGDEYPLLHRHHVPVRSRICNRDVIGLIGSGSIIKHIQVLVAHLYQWRVDGKVENGSAIGIGALPCQIITFVQIVARADRREELQGKLEGPHTHATGHQTLDTVPNGLATRSKIGLRSRYCIDPRQSIGIVCIVIGNRSKI